MVKIDPEFQTLITPLTDDEYQRLEKSILAEGVRECIITWDDTIIDGHNRYRICQKYNINCPSKERKFESRDAAKIWIIENQFARRNLESYVRGALSLKLKSLYAAEAKRRQLRKPKDFVSQKSDEQTHIRTDERIAKLAGVSRDTIRKIEVIESEAANGNPVAIEVKAELESGEKKSIHGAYVKVTGKEKPRKPKETVADDGRRLCVMCGEPIDEGEAHAARPTVHKKCEQEYQRDWERDKRQRTSAARKAYLDAEKSLRENVAIYTVDSLYDELVSTAENLRDAWAQSIEINESMGVEISEQSKKLLKNAVDNLFKTAQQIKEDN